MYNSTHTYLRRWWEINSDLDSPAAFTWETEPTVAMPGPLVVNPSPLVFACL